MQSFTETDLRKATYNLKTYIRLMEEYDWEAIPTGSDAQKSAFWQDIGSGLKTAFDFTKDVATGAFNWAEIAYDKASYGPELDKHFDNVNIVKDRFNELNSKLEKYKKASEENKALGEPRDQDTLDDMIDMYEKGLNKLQQNNKHVDFTALAAQAPAASTQAPAAQTPAAQAPAAQTPAAQAPAAQTPAAQAPAAQTPAAQAPAAQAPAAQAPAAQAPAAQAPAAPNNSWDPTALGNQYADAGFAPKSATTQQQSAKQTKSAKSSAKPKATKPAKQAAKSDPFIVATQQDLNKRLAQIGKPPIKVDGINGPKTREALRTVMDYEHVHRRQRAAQSTATPAAQSAPSDTSNPFVFSESTKYSEDPILTRIIRLAGL